MQCIGYSLCSNRGACLSPTAPCVRAALCLNPHLLRLSSTQRLGLAQVGRSTPVLLAPVRRTAEIRTGTAKVGARAAQARLALLVHNRSAGLALARIRAARNRRLRGRLLGVALSVARLAPVAAVQCLVLDVVLGPAVACR